MTLRVRLTGLIVFTVAVVLLATGIGLHLLLRASLYRGLDTELRDTTTMLTSRVARRDGTATLAVGDEARLELRGDMAALLLAADGTVLDRFGAPLSSVPEAPPGFSTQDDLRVLRTSVGTATLLVARDFDDLEDSLERFDAVFFVFSPFALAAAAVLGYLLAGRGLAPVDRLTRNALDLAERRAWQERVHEPPRRDELWRLARATNELLAALAGVITREQRFTANAAHELRTPLTVLQGRVEQAFEGSEEPVTRARLAKALASSEQLLQLTEALLVLARSEAGRGNDFSPIALDELAFEASEGVRGSFREKGLTLHLRLPDEPLWVHGDASTLAALLRNLLDNASKFTPCGSVVLEVVRKGTEAHALVEDTGPGIPEEDLPRVFEPFFQSDVRHRRMGSGLGLALSRAIAEWHGGRLEVTNRAGGGARVTLVLPFGGAPDTP